MGVALNRTSERRALARLPGTVAVLLAAMGLTLVAACGTDSGGSGSSSDAFTQVVPAERTFELADLQAIGYKTSKTYDVEGLNDATAAYYGFWQPPSESEPVDYEVRIYPSHTVAIESGTAQAEEGSGEDAVLDRTLATWTEGLTERRRIVGGSSRGGSFPRYSDYVIVGNLIVLCQGRNAEHSQDRCDDLVSALHQ